MDTTPDSNVTPAWVWACKSDYPGRPMLHTPIVFDWSGVPWTAATNGHRLGAVRGARSDAKSLTELGAAGPNIVSVLKRPESNANRETVRVGELRQWFQSDKLNPDCLFCHGKGQVVCDNCKGEGEVECRCRCGDEHDSECRHCEGKGTRFCQTCLPSKKEMDLGKLFGVVVNRNILREVLANLPYEWCYFHSAGDNAAWFYDDSHEWLLLLMPMRSDPHRDKDIPVFTPREQAAA